MSVVETLPYRSPISKLLRFFPRSRDKWKAKCKEAKRENKSLKYRLAVMTESRNRWKAKAQGCAESVAEQTAPVEKKPPKNRPGGASRSRPARPGVAAGG